MVDDIQEVLVSYDSRKHALVITKEHECKLKRSQKGIHNTKEARYTEQHADTASCRGFPFPNQGFILS